MNLKYNGRLAAERSRSYSSVWGPLTEKPRAQKLLLHFQEWSGTGILLGEGGKGGARKAHLPGFLRSWSIFHRSFDFTGWDPRVVTAMGNSVQSRTNETELWKRKAQTFYLFQVQKVLGCWVLFLV